MRELKSHKKEEHFKHVAIKCTECDFQCRERERLQRHYFRMHQIGSGELEGSGWGGDPGEQEGYTPISLSSEDQKFEIRCTHARTSWDSSNAFP